MISVVCEESNHNQTGFEHCKVSLFLPSFLPSFFPFPYLAVRHLDDPQVGVLAGLHVKEVGILDEEGEVCAQRRTEDIWRGKRGGREGTLINE